MIYLSALLIILVQILCLFSRVPYSCKPYTPQDECDVGRYEIEFYEHMTDKQPIGKAEAHCIKTIDDFIYAETGRVVAFSLTQKEIEDHGPYRNVQYFEEQQFPNHNIKACKF